MNYTIRRATQDDKSDIQILIDAFIKETEHYPLAEKAGEMEHYYEYARTGISHNDPVLVAQNPDCELVGLLLWVEANFVYGTRLPPHTIAALGTYVIPLYRRHNVASRLRDAGFKIMREQGYQRAVGTIHQDNHAGSRSLEKRGWKTAFSVIVKELS